MPYLNDRIAANEEQNARNRLNVKASRESRYTFDPEGVVAELKRQIVGQDAVITAMSDMLYVLKADFADANKPLSVNLFLGPTGVGKTEMVRALAKALLGDRGGLCRIDMNTLAQEHYAAALTGAPPGYVGSKEGHTLFDIESIEGSFSRPGIVLFDEIEKASKEVIRSILNILDTGRLRLTGGTKTINFSNSLIFMTSNIGARELAARQQRQAHRKWLKWKARSFDLEPWSLIEPTLKKVFDPEFLNRVERTILFNPLEQNFIEQIIHLEIEKLNSRLARKNAKASINEQAKTKIASFYNYEYGARNIAQLIRLKIHPVIAKALVQQKDRQCFLVGYERDSFIICQ